MGEEFVSCSKKCKKVTKFAYMLKQNNEQEILRAFESMLRKKLNRKHTQQTDGRGKVRNTLDALFTSSNQTERVYLKGAISKSTNSLGDKGISGA
jgi:hypothetical protein